MADHIIAVLFLKHPTSSDILKPPVGALEVVGVRIIPVLPLPRTGFDLLHLLNSLYELIIFLLDKVSPVRWIL